MIPVFEAQIVDPSDGIFKISLVDMPAVESNFLYFNKEDKCLKFAVADEEQHIVFGVLMRADYNIYRYSPEYGEYYIRYTKDTIKKMAEKMLSDGVHNNINLQHEDGTDVTGVNLVEVFIKDVEHGIDPAGFEHIEDGSLFTKYKVENEKVWQSIKDGTFMGFSLEGYFEIEPTGEQMMSKNKDKNTFKKYMNRLTKKIVNSIVKFGSVKTDQGELYWVGEGQLEIGDELFKEEGEDRVKVEDGTYVTEDKVEITVTEGLVSEIKTPEEVEETPAEEEEDMKKKKAACEDEDPVDDDPAKEDDVRAEIDDLKAEMETMKAEIERLRGEIEAIKGEPAQQPVMDEYEKVAKVKTNDSKLNNAINIVSKLKQNKK